MILRTSSLLALTVAVTPVASAAITDGLVHHWGGNGDTADDVGGADGVLGSTTAYGTGLWGQAFDFDARQSSVMTLPFALSPTALPTVTVGMWVRLDTVANNRGWVIGHDDGGYDRSIALHDDRYGWGVGGGTGTGPHVSTLDQPRSSLGQWICVAAAYDSGAHAATFYSAVDGAASTSQSVWAIPWTGNPTTTLGGLTNFTGHTIDGQVDEVFVYDRALTAAELDAACAWFAEGGDTDGDGVTDANDVCDGGDDRVDTDGDGTPDDCDTCPDDALDDSDGDGTCDSADLCVGDDTTGDGDGDGVCDDGDVCWGDDTSGDGDGDGWCDDTDNCPEDTNADQADADGDGVGDACTVDPDTDGDGVDDVDDACAGTEAGAVVDASGCSGAQLVALACERSAFRNRGLYVSCVARAANAAVSAGLLTDEEHDALVQAAAGGR